MCKYGVIIYIYPEGCFFVVKKHDQMVIKPKPTKVWMAPFKCFIIEYLISFDINFINQAESYISCIIRIGK
jgi:hypothetical protein